MKAISNKTLRARTASQDHAAKAEARAELGLRYIQGTHGVHKDIDRGLKLIRLAVAAQHPAGLTNLGISYRKGIGISLPSDTAGIDLFKQAIARDPSYAPAYYQLGMHCADKKNHEKAVAYFEQAVEGNPNFSPALLMLGRYCIEGMKSTKYPNTEAAEFFQRALAEDPQYREALYWLGWCRLQGVGGVELDYQKAIALFKPASAGKEGYAPASAALGDCYVRAYGVEENNALAFGLYQRALCQRGLTKPMRRDVTHRSNDLLQHANVTLDYNGRTVTIAFGKDPKLHFLIKPPRL